MAEIILGISAYYHDSAAALLVDGEVVAAAHEDRFSRKKQDSTFPDKSVRYVLEEAGITLKDVDTVAFYDKPLLKFERIMETYASFAPSGFKSFAQGVPVWVKEKMFMKRMLREELEALAPSPEVAKNLKLVFPEHHLSHAASAFYPSPFEKAAILTLDGVGEWATSTIGYGEGSTLTMLRELDFPHSLGLLYSAFTYYCGFKVNSGEYKLMGLAPYGAPDSDEVKRFRELITESLVDVREDGSILLNMDYFDFATGLRMCRDKKWEKLFGLPKREQESLLTQSYMNLALAAQQVTEDIVLAIARTAKKLTGAPNLVMAGGVALNCVANGKLVRSGIFDDVWIQPAAGDAGGALGAAYAAWHIGKEKPREIDGKDKMKGSYLGPAYSNEEVGKRLRRFDVVSKEYEKFDELCEQVVAALERGEVVGWHQGRMEWGPRALGARSILGDSRHPEMQKRLNLKIKYREGFRPFAPSVLAEDNQEYFDMKGDSPYMLLVAPVQESRRNPLPDNYDDLELYDRLYHLRSDVPSITHVDYSARVQTVHQETNERYWRLLQIFKEQTGYGLIVNTSFNVRGEPIVCTPEDSYRCFMRTEMDWLVIEDRLYDKREQPEWQEEGDWRDQYELD